MPYARGKRKRACFVGQKGPVLGATVVFDVPCLFSETILEAHAQESMDARLPSEF